MASLNGFSVKVPECNAENNDGYVVIQHGQIYSLKLSNHHLENGHGKACDAEVYLDSEFIGSYRIPYGQTRIIERPVNSNQRFTAYKIGSKEAKIAEIRNNSSMGLICVIFRPGTKNIKYNEIDPIFVPKQPFPEYPPYPGKIGVYAYAVSDWDTLAYSNTFQEEKCITNPLRSNGLHTAEKGGMCIKDVGFNADRSFVGGGTGLSGRSFQEFEQVDSLDYDEPATTISMRLAFDDTNEIRPLRRVTTYNTRIPKPV